MTDKQSAGLDIVQRITEVLSRTSEPEPTAVGSLEDGGEVIGSVPIHLRRLHNLLDELSTEVITAERLYCAASERMMIVRNLFLDALKTQVPVPEDASTVIICDNWDMVAYRSDDGMGDPGAQMSVTPVNGHH